MLLAEDAEIKEEVKGDKSQPRRDSGARKYEGKLCFLRTDEEVFGPLALNVQTLRVISFQM